MSLLEVIFWYCVLAWLYEAVRIFVFRDAIARFLARRLEERGVLTLRMLRAAFWLAVPLFVLLAPCIEMLAILRYGSPHWRPSGVEHD